MQTANAEATRVTSETKNAQSPVTDTSLDGGSPEKTSLSTGVSSEVSDDISSDTSISTDTQNVNGKFEGNERERGVSKNMRTDAAI